MYSYVKGELKEKGKDRAIVETPGGVAYEILIADSERSRFPDSGVQVKIFTHLYVREDAQRLYGFVRRSNRDFFRQLLTLNGVGPSMGLSILSDLGAERFRQAVHDQDLEALKTIHGVGQKTGRRLILEMAEKLPEQPEAGVGSRERQFIEEATEALMGLGFNKGEASRVVKKAADRDNFDTLEELIEEGLSLLESSD